MNSQIEQILLESYDFERRKRFAIEYSWKAVFRIIPVSKNIPDLYYVAVSNNYIQPKGLQVDMVRELLDIKEIVTAIESRFQEYLDSGSNTSEIGKFFITDEE